jgi:hypothetical protein
MYCSGVMFSLLLRNAAAKRTFGLRHLQLAISFNEVISG